MKKTSSILKKFRETCMQKCRLAPGKLLVAVSGGPDSVALLHLLLHFRAEWGIEPVLAHVNHRLREESEADQAFCEALAGRLGIPFVCRRVETGAHAESHKLSLETAARELRYAALTALAASEACGDIALGHTANDQAETVLGNLIRGTGVRGLAGMPYRRDRLVRPLLAVQRREILAYLADSGLEYREDVTNQKLDFRRNFIRHRVVPILQKSVNARIIEALCRTAQNTLEVEAYLDAQARQATKRIVRERTLNKIVLDIEQISAYFSLLQKYIIRNLLFELSNNSIRPDFAALTRAESLISRAEIGKRIPLHAGWELLIDHDGAVIWDGKTKEFFVTARPGEQIRFNCRRIFQSERLAIQDLGSVYTSATPFLQFVDGQKVIGKLRIRSVRAGDKFHPLGAGGHKTVFQLLSDRKVPLHRRQETPVVECDAGILWVAGLQLDERFKITKQTTHVLKLEIREELSC